MKPTIGRQVVFYAFGSDKLALEFGNVPMAATVCHVHEDGRLNLSVLSPSAGRHSRIRVPLMDNSNRFTVSESYCMWPTIEKPDVQQAAEQGYRGE